MRLSIGIAAIVSSLVLTSGSPARAETSSIDGREAMTRALQGAWLPLESGLIVGAREGTPLSAKDEIEMVRSNCRFTRQSPVCPPGTPSRRSSWITVPAW